MSSSKPRSDAQRLLACAIRYAGRGVRSSHQVRAYLTRLGTASGAVARILTACRARGLVDDLACARLRADDLARRGYARAAIFAKLSGQGLAEQDIAAAARGLGDDAARAREVAQTHLRRSGRRASRAGPQRVARVLASRGFDADLIEQILADSGDRSHAER